MKGSEDLIHAAVAILVAEGSVDERELEFLEMLRKHLGLSEDFVQATLAQAREGKLKVRLPAGAGDRRRMLGVMVRAAAANGQIAPEERRLLAMMAQKTGVSEGEMNVFVERALQAVPGRQEAAPAPQAEPEEEKPPEHQPSVSSDEVTDGFKCLHCGKKFVKADALHNGVPRAKGTITRVYCPHCRKHVLTSPSVSSEWTVIRLELVGAETMPGKEVFGTVDTTME